MSNVTASDEIVLTGPLLAVAVFCDQILEDKDMAISCIRIADNFTITLPPDTPDDVPSESKRISFPTRGLVSFRKGGLVERKHRVRLLLRSTDGKTGSVFDQELTFAGDEPTSLANVRFDLTLLLRKGGLFWMTVLVDDHELTKVPLTVNVERAPKGADAAPPDSVTVSAC
jgi:hypothetical protein